MRSASRATSGRRARCGGRGRGRRRGRRAPAAHGHEAVVGGDDVAGAGEQEAVLVVRHHQEGLEAAQHAIGAPVLGELDRRALEVAAVLLELRLEPGEEGQGVGGRSREAGEHLAALEAADLAGSVLHHGAAEGDLAVAGEGAAPAVADGEDGGAVERGAGHGRFAREGRRPSIEASDTILEGAAVALESAEPGHDLGPLRPGPRGPDALLRPGGGAALRRARPGAAPERAAQRRLHPRPGRGLLLGTRRRRGRDAATSGSRECWPRAWALRSSCGITSRRARPRRSSSLPRPTARSPSPP